MGEIAVSPGRHGPFSGHLDPATVAAYAAATGDRTSLVLDGQAVPATYPAILIFDAQEAARADVPAAAWERVRGGVQGAHDIVLHRPLRPGERLSTRSWISAVRESGAGTQVVMQFEQTGDDGSVAVEQWWTMVLLGLRGMTPLGEAPADHRFPDDARRVRRVAVRFASPTPLDSELTVNVFGIDGHSFAFEATANGTTTITHGRLELRT